MHTGNRHTVLESRAGGSRRGSSSSRVSARRDTPKQSTGWHEPDGLIRWIRLMLLAVVTFFTFFVNNGVLVPDIMESRNLITAREMLDTGEYMAPTMNGELRLAKPPLPTWIAAAVEHFSPDDVAMQRSAAGLAGVMLTIFLYLFARRILRIDPLWPALLLLTCYNVVLMGRTASWDIYCHAFMLGGIYFMAKAIAMPGRGTAAFAWSGVFIGLSILSKGPVSLYALLLPWLLSFIICGRHSMKGKWGGVALMVVVAVVCGCWWYAFIYANYSEQLKAVAAQESGAWINRNVRPWYYYHQFYLEAGIWALLLISAIILSFTSHRHKSRESYMPLLWMLLSLVLLSLLPEKKTRYLLPVLIPASLVMGQLICRWIEDFRHPSSASRTDKFLFRLNAWLLAAVVLALPVAAWWFCYMAGYMSLWVLALLGLACLCVTVALATGAVRLRPQTMVWGVAAIFITAEAVALPAVKPLINNPDMHSIRLTADMPQLKGVPFYANAADELRIEMVYAARRNITRIPYTDSALNHITLPAVILSHKGAAAELPQQFLQKADTTYIGRFDDNRRPKNTRRYDPRFIYHLTLLKPRQQK